MGHGTYGEGGTDHSSIVKSCSVFGISSPFVTSHFRVTGDENGQWIMEAFELRLLQYITIQQIRSID